jgi:ATP-dependent DNA helicase RecG
LEESIVNAVYHRGYDQREPIEVRVNPESIEVVSYPGPDPSIRPEDLAGRRIVARRYRNRRIGEFLKELEMTEGRSTGIPKIRAAMRANGSLQAFFETDDERTFFLVRFPIHPGLAEAGVEAGVKAGVRLSETEVRILRLLRHEAKGTKELVVALGQQRSGSKVSGNLKKALEHLTELGLIGLTLPETPNSRFQKRILTHQGAALLAKVQ